MKRANKTMLSFSPDQTTKINNHLDSICEYLSQIQQKLSSNARIEVLKNYLYITHESIWIFDFEVLELEREPKYFELSLYDHPHIAYEFLLNWDEVKKALEEELLKLQHQSEEIDSFLDGFII